MGKLVESTLVTIGGDIGAPDKWGAPYMDDEYKAYSAKLLAEANALLLGREGVPGDGEGLRHGAARVRRSDEQHPEVR